MPFRVDASGQRTEFFVGQQVDFDVPVKPDIKVRMVLPEGIQDEFEFQTSNEPSRNRDVVDTIEVSRRPAGPLNYELHTEGHGYLYKAALGSDEDVVTVPNADGGVRCQVAADYSSGGLALECDFIRAGFPSSGYIAVVYRTDGDIDEALTFVDTVQYTSRTNTVFTLAASLTSLGVPAGSVKVEDYVILFEDTPGEWDGVFTHFYVAGSHLNTVTTLQVHRDIEDFFYYSGKVQTISENYEQGNPLTGTIEWAFGAQFSGCLLNAVANVGDTFVELEDIGNDIRDADIFYGNGVGGRFWIGTESALLFTDVDPVLGRLTGIPAVGDGSITATHNVPPLAAEKPVVAFASAPDIDFSSNITALAGFNAAVIFRATIGNGFDMESIEVLSGNWTLNNNLFLEKVPLGTRDRAALPEGRREVTGTINVEFDSPAEYNRVLRGTKCRLEFDCFNEDTGEIGNTNVLRRNVICFQRVKFTGETPNAENNELITYDLNFQAFSGTRWPSAVKIVVNDQASAVAGG